MGMYRGMMSAICIAIALIMVSCSTNQDVVQGNLLQKRKYRKGFHLNLGKRLQPTDVATVSNAEAPSTAGMDREEMALEIPVDPSDVSVAPKAAKQSRPARTARKSWKNKWPRAPRLSLDPAAAMADQPTSTDMELTLTSSYQKKGKIALLLAWIYAIMPLVIWTINMFGFPVFSMVLSFFTLVVLILALVYAFKYKKYSKHARQALWVVLLAILFWAGIGVLMQLVLGLPLFLV